MHLLETPARLPFSRLLSYMIAAMLVFASHAVAGPVVLDPTFGTAGRVMTTFVPYMVDPPGNDIVVQPDGKIVVVGSGLNESILLGACMMARYNPDGSLDTTFDGDGKAFPAFGVIREICSSVALQPDGKIVASWITFRNLGDAFDTDVVTARFNTDGSLDATFGTGGRTITDVAGFNRINDVAVLPNGKIAAVGNSTTTSPYVLVYTSNGFLDTGFDGDGIRSITATDLMAVDGQADGKVVVTGNNTTFTTWRFNADGTPDTTFNGGGVISVPVGTGNATPAEMLVKPDGKILMVGTANGGTNNDITLVQLNSNGTPDLTFSDDGKVTTDTGAVENGVDVAVQADGKIVALGSNIFIWEVARYHPNGAIDKTFDGDGVTTATTNTTVPSAVALQPDGKIVATGSSRPDGFVVLRWLVRPAPVFDFDGDTKTDLSIFRPSLGQWWYLKSSGGNVNLQFGSGTDTIAPGDFTGDGKTDITYFRPSTGQWFVLRSEDFAYYAFNFGLGGDIPAPADYDGDGTTDAAVFRPSTNVWYINNSGGGVTIRTFGISGDLPVTADYDGDQRADIGIFRPSNGQWWIDRTTAGSLVVTFGTSTDKTVQGDYTGDGKADVAFYRPSTGQWFVLRSEDYAYYAFSFGLAGDVAAPGDYDGDGRNDAAVFRPSNSTWFVNRTTAGVMIQQFGLSSDIPVPNAFVR
jgi:uncharacterized delta-60 repeat protein